MTYKVLAQKINACSVLVIKSERWGSLLRPSHRWLDNIKMDFQEIGWDGMD
jgi:hypothetical protein